jgi:HupE/UreJ protein
VSLLLALGCAALALLSGTAMAHPLGNATVNRQAALTVTPGEVRLDFRMDMAEIPSLAAEAEADTNGDGTVDAGEWRDQARRWAAAAAAGLHLAVDDRPVAWRLERVEHELAVGEAGLPLLRLHARYRATLPATGASSTVRLALDDEFRPTDRGWREIWMAAPAGVRLDGLTARADRSQGLHAYPPGQPLLDERRAEVVVALSAPGKAPVATARAPEEAAAPTQAAPMAASAEAPSPQPTVVGPLPIPSPASHPAPSLAAMFRLGIHHILTGFDHLAFLAGLLLLTPGWRGAVKVVTAFTVAHSLTLFLAARGLVAVPPAWVEAAIALTVAWVGGLALVGRGRSHGFGLAFAFGLIHGLGFAGALAEILGAGHAPPLLPLLTFNLGIEACQLVLVTVVLGAVAAVRRQGAVLAPAYRLASLAVTGSGLAWFAMRVAG